MSLSLQLCTNGVVSFFIPQVGNRLHHQYSVSIHNNYLKKKKKKKKKTRQKRGKKKTCKTHNKINHTKRPTVLIVPPVMCRWQVKIETQLQQNVKMSEEENRRRWGRQEKYIIIAQRHKSKVTELTKDGAGQEGVGACIMKKRTSKKSSCVAALGEVGAMHRE